MDIDPLADTVPPRYAVESDEEDEYNPLEPKTAESEPVTTPEIKLAGSIPKDRPLIFASGDAGKYWAKGIKLGEQAGSIYVNKIQVGLVFAPSWSKSTVIVSETFTRLPLNYIHDYAEFILNELKPNSVSLLDVYSSPTYISPEPIAQQDAPIRYLSTAPADSTSKSTAQPFSPPNMIHSNTSAALMSLIASDPSQSLKGTLFLLPFPKIPTPPPKTLKSSDFSHLSEDEYQWSESFMNTAQNILFAAVGESISDGEAAAWHTPKNSHPPTSSAKASTFGEGGMYI
ncbi:hypothetical protein D9758_005744 [Tetrapyrgos nigripes]|uniref:Uncharacterized protein n=1 Tax=Tetrapyrgos nigripes TaxID=182062 RepID=A0A8H5GJS8_9AGAR|nr:hypothetical protein D9758_005744 [Tetrapyrgos nigripes]